MADGICSNLTSNLARYRHVRPVRVRPNEAMVMLRCGRAGLYEILPELESYVEGGARWITTSSIEAYNEGKVREAKKKAQVA